MHDLFSQILPPTGNIILVHESDFKKADGTTALNNIIFESRDALLTNPPLDKMGSSLWYDTSSYIKNTVNKYTGRTTINVSEVKALWLDLDIKDTGFTTRQSAIAAIVELCNKLSLPRPWVVNSGYGYHVYWPLQVAVNKEDWKQVASKFATIIGHLQIPVDFKVIYKVTQLMRVPGSFNTKRGLSVPVTIDVEGSSDLLTLDDYRLKFDNFINVNNITAVTNVPPIKSTPSPLGFLDHIPINSGIDLPAMPVSVSEPKSATSIIDQCAQIRNAPFASEPTWRAMLTVIRLCENGDGECHALSKADAARYDHTATQQKLDYMRHTHPADGMPSTCYEFDKLNPNICQNCQHFNRIKSPIILGKKKLNELVLPTVPDPAPPESITINDWVVPNGVHELGIGEYHFANHQYFVSNEGTFVVTTKDGDNGIPVRINTLLTQLCIFPIVTIDGRDEGGQPQISHVWRCILPDKTFKDAIIPASKMMSDSGLLALFGNYFGLVIPNRGLWEAMSGYLRSVLAAAITNKSLPVHSVQTHMGWNDTDYFVLGNEMYEPGTGNIIAPQLSNGLKKFAQDMFNTVGTIEGWRECANAFNRDDMMWAQLIIGAGFGAPLAKYTEARGFIYSVFGESGAGKTTVQKVANAIWGHPSKLIIKSPGTSHGDTSRAADYLLGQLHSLPVNLDELTLVEPSKLVAWVYSCSQGRDKTRLGQGVDSREFTASTPHEWHTIFCSSSNASLKDKIAEGTSSTDVLQALNQRVFEIGPVSSPNDFNVSINLDDGMRRNYGVVGKEYIRTLQANPALVKNVFDMISDRLRTKLRPIQAERFIISGLTSIFTGLYIAQQLGYIDYDLTKIEDYITAQFADQRDIIIESKELHSAIFNDMLSHLVPQTIIINTRRFDGGGESISVAKSPRFDQLLARVNTTDGTILISSSAVKDYAKLRGVSYRDILRIAASENYCDRNPQSVRRLIGASIPEFQHVGRVSTYEFKLPEVVIKQLISKVEKTDA